MRLEDKLNYKEIELINKISNKIKNLITTKVLVYGLAGSLVLLSCIPKTQPPIPDKKFYKGNCDEVYFDCNKYCIIGYRQQQRAGKEPGRECHDYCDTQYQNCKK